MESNGESGNREQTGKSLHLLCGKLSVGHGWQSSYLLQEDDLALVNNGRVIQCAASVSHPDYRCYD